MGAFHFRSNKLSAVAPGTLLSVDPQTAGWEHLAFEALHLPAGEVLEKTTGTSELALVVMAGVIDVDSSEGTFKDLGHRNSVFEGAPHALYLPIRTRYRIHARTGAEVALCSAHASKAHPAKRIRPDEVEIEERGEGNASRRIHHVLKPEFSAERLMIVEVLTPSGNWSSYPPHKHDEHRPPHEHDLEEIYYYRIDRPEGFALQRLYTADGSRDVTVTARDGDLVLIHEGYHPVVAAPGCNVYYLNALAGTGRSMAATDDPEFAWVRSAWTRPQRPIT